MSSLFAAVDDGSTTAPRARRVPGSAIGKLTINDPSPSAVGLSAAIAMAKPAPAPAPVQRVPFDNWQDPQAAFFLAAQTGVPVLAEGPPGVAKGALCFAFARAIRRKMIHLISSCRAPEDYSGLPTPNYKDGFVRMLPMDWARAAAAEACVVFLDELNTAEPAKRAPQLSMLTENRIGDTDLHPDTIYLAACNPEDMAENGSPLSLAMKNRFYHHKWELDINAWRSGLANPIAPLTWSDSSFPILPSDWRNHLGPVTQLVDGFLRANATRALVVPTDESTAAFPSPRSWTNLVKVIAAARCMKAPLDVQTRMMNALIGKAVSVEFREYIDNVDLVDPNAVLDGHANWEWDAVRTDRNSVFLSSLFSAVRANPTRARWTKGVHILFTAGEQCPEMALLYVKEAMAMVPDKSAWTPDILKKLAELEARCR